MANKSIISNSKLDAIAAAIAAKDGGTGAMTADQMATRIAAIPTGDIDGLLDGSPSFTELVTGAAKLPGALFYGDPYITRVVMTTDRQITINANAFLTASGLTEFSAPNSLAIQMMDSAFAQTSALTEMRGNFMFVGYNCFSSSGIKKFISTHNGSCNASYLGFASAINLELLDMAGKWAFGSSCFSSCANLKTIVLRDAANMSTLYRSTDLDDCHADLAIYVPDALVASYQAATNWASYASKIHPLSEYVEPSI